jgi:hypothetical protein
MIDPGIISALIAAVASLAVAIYGLVKGKANERELEALRSALAEQRAERDAWRDYQYEARKRLYQECEPLFFKLREGSEVARDRIRSLASRARQGRLRESAPSLLEREGHYATSTYYQLMVPVAIFRLLQRKLTVVDLDLDPIARTQYELAKWLYMTFASEYIFAAADPAIEYTPDLEGENRRRDHKPSQFWRQGLARARLDVIAETLIVRDDREGPRCMSYGEFETAYFDQQSELRDIWRPMADIFHLFHPRTRPILWRMLITQIHILTAIIESNRDLEARRSSGDMPKPVRRLTESERSEFDWRMKDEDVCKDHVVEPFTVAETLLKERLSRLCNI